MVTGPDQDTVPVPVPFTPNVPSNAPHDVGCEIVPCVITGNGRGAAVIEPAALTHPLIVCVTVYEPADDTVIDGVDPPVDHSKFEPDVVKVEFPQLFTTVTTGVVGTVKGAAVPEPGVLAHPPTVCVTVYAPADETVIDGVEAPVDHNKFVPVAVNTELPQLFTTETTGAEGTTKGAAVPVAIALTHPATV